MAAADILALNPLVIAGLGKPLEQADMVISHDLYNALPNIRDQPCLKDEHIVHVKALLDIIQSHGLGDVFGVHAAHSHDAIPSGTVRFETRMGINGFTWTKPTVIEKPDANKMHATLFKFGGNDLVPIEFAEGPSPVDLTKIPAEFLPEFCGYLTKHGLNNVIAMQVGDFARPNSTAELEVQWGQDFHFTLVMPTSLLKAGPGNLIRTGWTVATVGEPEEPPKGQHWNKVLNPPNTHKVHVSGIEPLTPDSLIQALVEQEVIVA